MSSTLTRGMTAEHSAATYSSMVRPATFPKGNAKVTADSTGRTPIWTKINLNFGRLWSELLRGLKATTGYVIGMSGRNVCSRPWWISPVCLFACDGRKRYEQFLSVFQQDWQPESLPHYLKRFEAEPTIGHEFVVL